MTLDLLQKRHIVITVAKFIFSGISMYILYRAQRNLTYFSEGYTGIIDNWNKDQIGGIYTSMNFSTAGNEYKGVWSGIYKGTVAGCDCPYSDSEKGVKRGLHRNACSTNETECSCVDISQISPIPVKNWVNQDMTFLKFIGSSSFSALHDNMNSDGSCKSGFKRCGNPNSISQGLCVPESWPECPITDISIGQTNPNPDYFTESANFLTYSIFYTRSPAQNPIPNLDAGEYVMCENPQRAGLTPGRRPYVLYRPSTDNCKTDTRYTALDDMGEQDMLIYNQFPYQYLPQFYTSNQYRWKRFFRRVIEWRPACLDEVIELNRLDGDIQGTESFCFAVTVISYILIVGKIVTDIYELVYVLKNMADDRRVRIAIWIRVGLNAVVLPLLAIIVSKSSPLNNYFSVLITRKCSDDYTNDYFDGLHETMKYDVYMLNLMALSIGLLTLALDIYDQFITMIKKRQDSLEAAIPRAGYQNVPEF